MNFKKVFVLFGLVVMMAAGQIVFAEETATAPTEPAEITSSQTSVSGNPSDMQWVWGEITNLDSQAKTLTLKYLDYETDQEKELVIAVDEKTTFENIDGFSGLKLADALSVDYTLAAENKNIAKNISFEKPDTAPVAVVSSESSPLDLAQPLSKEPAPVEPAPVPATGEPAVAVQETAQ